MHDPQLVGLGQCTRDVAHDVDGLELIERARPVEPRKQVLALQQFHGDVGHVSPHAEVVDLHHIRAAEPRRRPGFALEAAPGVFAAHGMFADEFDGAGHLERRVVGAPHGTHSTARDFFFEAETPANDFPRFEHSLRPRLAARAENVVSAALRHQDYFGRRPILARLSRMSLAPAKLALFLLAFLALDVTPEPKERKDVPGKGCAVSHSSGGSPALLLLLGATLVLTSRVRRR